MIARDEFPSGSSVLLPAFIPRSVVQAFRAGGFEVEYYPIESALRLPADEVRDRIEAVEPDVVVFVHYFGFADPAFGDLVDAARTAGAAVIEDCARSLFSRDPDGTLLGTTGEYALFSLYKILPVPNGGLVVSAADDGSLPHPATVRSEYREAVTETLHSTFRTVGVRPAALKERVTGNGTNGTEAGWKRDVEPRSSVAAPGQLTRIGLQRTLPGTVVDRRARQYAELRGALEDVDGLDLLTPPLHDGASPFGVAIRLHEGSDACERVQHRVSDAGLPVQRLRWRLRPDEQDPDRYPGAMTLRRQMLVLPTHQQVPPGTGETVAETIEEALRQ
jgi:dTDP-4-amino-4,6-dideoxygalactose transaminase